ncbi:hypothetical protein Mapa_006909 [Marchantia paleacea]|nr:hypothetical protein Mapa_006909 [Marchantia paleacea]
MKILMNAWLRAVLGLACVLIVRTLSWMRKKKGAKLRLPPGPPNWPIIGALLHMERKIFLSFTRLNEKYGPVVYFRLGVHSVVVCSSAETCEEVLKQKDAIFAQRPNTTIQKAPAKYLGFDCSDMGFSHYDPKMTILRKICIQEFLSHSKIKSYEKDRTQQLYQLMQSIKHHGLEGKPVTLRPLLDTMATNYICFLLYRRGYTENKLAVSNDLRKFNDVAARFARLVMLINISDLIPMFERWDPQGVLAEYKSFHHYVKDLFGRVIQEHREAGRSGGENFVDVLLSYNEKGLITENQIMGTLMVRLPVVHIIKEDMMAAGIDTNSSVVEWAMLELVNHPKQLKRLQDEVDSVVGKDRALQEEDIPQLEFLNAVCKETLRRHSVVPLLQPHFNLVPTTIGGFDIPANTAVFINQYAMARDPRIWDDPLSFRPERFLDAGRDIGATGTDFRFLPFGSGRRACIGMNMGLLVFKCVLASLVHAFDWTLPPGVDHLDGEERNGSVLRPAAPVTLVALPRLPPHIYNRE